MIDFSGKTVLVTGGGRGQGEAECVLFAKLGARAVIVADVDIEPAQAVAGAIGDRAVAWQLDVADAAGWDAVLDMAIRDFGGIDVLVNNAAIFRSGRIDETPLETVDAMIAINLRGTYLGVSKIGSHMHSGSGGAIVNVASVGALSPGENSAIYGMTKGGVVTLTRGAAVEFGPNVRINCVLPGGVATRMLSSGSPAYFDTVPLGRVGQSEDIANAVAYLASSAAAYCTGTSIVVDGGWTLGQTAATFAGVTRHAENGRVAAEALD